MQEFFTRVFGAAFAFSLIGKQVQVSFDPAGYEEWLRHHCSHVGTHYLEVPKRPHCSVGMISGFDYHLTPSPHLILNTTIGSIAGISIGTIEWHREVNSPDEGRWTARFQMSFGEGAREQIVPILFKILD